MFADLLQDLKQNRQKLQIKKENDENKINSLVQEFNNRQLINEIEKERDLIQQQCQKIEDNSQAMKLQVESIQYTSSQTFKDFKKLKNKRMNIENLMNTISYHIQIKNSIPLFKGAIKSNNLRECNKVIQEIKKSREYIIDDLFQKEWEQIAELEQELQIKTDKLLQQGVKNNDLEMISLCSLVSDNLTKKEESSIFLLNLMRIYEDKIKEDLKDIYVSVMQQNEQDLEKEYKEIEEEQEQEDLLFASKFITILRKIAKVFKLIIQNKTITDSEIVFTLYRNILNQDMIKQTFQKLLSQLKQFYQQKDIFCDEATNISYQIYNIYELIVQLLRNKDENIDENQLLQQYEDLEILKMNQDLLFDYIHHENQMIEVQVNQILENNNKYNQKRIKSMEKELNTVIQPQLQFIDLVELFFINKQAIKRSLLTKNKMAISSISNQISNQVFPELMKQFKQITNNMLKHKIQISKQNIWSNHYCIDILNDLELSIEYLTKLKEQVYEEHCFINQLDKVDQKNMIYILMEEVDSNNNKQFQNMISNSIKEVSNHLIRSIQQQIEQYQMLSFVIQQNQLYEIEAQAHYAEKFIKQLRNGFKQWQEQLSESMFQRLMKQLIKEIMNSLINITYKQKFNQIGGIYFDKEMRTLQSFFQEYCRIKEFQQMNLICELLMMDSKQEIIEMIENSNIQEIGLKGSQLLKVVNLRSDL